MTETDEEFLRVARGLLDDECRISPAILDRLFTLARRGAEAQTVGHLDDGETAALRTAMRIKIDEKQFLAAVDREGDYECGAGKLADDTLPPPPKGDSDD